MPRAFSLALIALLSAGPCAFATSVDEGSITRGGSTHSVPQALDVEGSVFKVYGSAEDRREPTSRKEQTHESGGIDEDDGSGATGNTKTQRPPASRANDFLTFSSSNEDYPVITSSPWLHLAEPYRATKLVATSTVGDRESDIFTWTFIDGTVLEGREVTHTFKAVGRQELFLLQTIVASGKTVHLEGFVMVKYVRREVRQLTNADREAFFDALETIYRVPTAEGQLEHGDEYKGIEFFVQMHLSGAGTLDCDHWHDDAGIMTHHVGYTLLFEQALQVINPAVSVPYWEYTIESAAGLTSYGQSDVFAADWFGTASPENSFHTVDEGRWAYLPVMKGAENSVHNAYGLLRTPWNLDSTPYVTRHNMTVHQVSTSMVDCELYQLCFDSEDLSMLNNCLNGGTHGPVHILVGGEWDNPEHEFINSVGYSGMTPLISKYLWRKGYLRVPESCSVETDGTGDTSTCRASCPAELYESRGMTPYDVLIDVHALLWIGRFSGGVIRHIAEEDRFVVAGHEDDEEFQEAFWENMLRSFCDPGHVGELYTSAAPYDPLFWVIHPTAERFMGWRRKLSRQGVEGYDFDESWGYLHGYVVGETGTICDWKDVREGSLDMPTCSKGICGGHKALDMLPFKVKVSGDERQMSNIEWLDFIYPDNEDLPYMYNEYRWDHCSAQGYHMGTVG